MIGLNQAGWRKNNAYFEFSRRTDYAVPFECSRSYQRLHKLELFATTCCDRIRAEKAKVSYKCVASSSSLLDLNWRPQRASRSSGNRQLMADESREEVSIPIDIRASARYTKQSVVVCLLPCTWHGGCGIQASGHHFRRPRHGQSSTTLD
jgi:hypothetical protein